MNLVAQIGMGVSATGLLWLLLALALMFIGNVSSIVLFGLSLSPIEFRKFESIYAVLCLITAVICVLFLLTQFRWEQVMALAIQPNLFSPLFTPMCIVTTAFLVLACRRKLMLGKPQK
ncbi:MAG: hypothetical protein AAGH99_11585 [Planctomycetota bacterium]